LSLEQFIADWVAANFLDDPAAGPRYYYRNLDLVRPSFEMQVDELPVDVVRQLDQYSTHFIDLDLRGPVTITFAADTIADLIEVPPRNGELMWFVPGVDDADAQLTAAFDLSGLERATLRFSTWYELEEAYDFAYVSVSSDEGESWEFLKPDHSTPGEYGPSFNGRSILERDSEDGWLKESISLDNYVGGPLLIRFEVLTDFETDHLGSGRGFAVDEISIPELGYQSDVETPVSSTGGPAVDGWIANGFVQTGWQLPQQWAVLLLESGPQPKITRLPLNHLNQVQWAFEIGKGGGTLAIIPLTPFIDEMASYWLHIEQ
jgi:immune inhibitor A